jgi:hypothetical protein
MANATHNERVQLTATLLNSAANSCFAVGIAAPIVAAFFSGSFDYRRIVVSMVTWFGCVVLAHPAAQHVLRGIRDEQP